MRFAANALATPQSGIREIVHKVIESGEDVVRLEIGEAFSTPRHVVDGALLAARGGATRYTNSAGLTSLREALCLKLERINSVDVAPENIAITTGAIEGIFLALASICERGDEILIPDPGWPNYEMIGTLLGVKCHFYPCRPENGCIPNLNDIEALITARTKVLIVNSPNNPTGAVYPEHVIRDLVGLSRSSGLVLLSDETYDQLYLDGKPVSAMKAKSGRSDNVIAVYSFSKTYGMTGWRVGYVVGHPDLIEMIAKLQEPVNSCVSSVSQHAALTALAGPQDFVARQRRKLRKARDAACQALDGRHCEYVVPRGAFYLWLNVMEDSSDFAYRLLAEEQIAVAPGAAFGPGGEGFVRICLAPLGENAHEVMSRIAERIRGAITVA